MLTDDATGVPGDRAFKTSALEWGSILDSNPKRQQPDTVVLKGKWLRRHMGNSAIRISIHKLWRRFQCKRDLNLLEPCLL